jgi:hypothetical protein
MNDIRSTRVLCCLTCQDPRQGNESSVMHHASSSCLLYLELFDTMVDIYTIFSLSFGAMGNSTVDPSTYCAALLHEVSNVCRVNRKAQFFMTAYRNDQSVAVRV